MSSPMEQTKYPDASIDISVYGELLTKNETVGDSYTLLVKLNSEATIDDVYFSHNMQLESMRVKKLNIAAPKTRTFNVKFLREYSVVNDGNNGITFPVAIKYSEYEAVNPEESFVYNDTDTIILKLLLHLWRKNYTDRVKTFDDFFEEFSNSFPDILKRFREHTYNFQVVKIHLSSS